MKIALIPFNPIVGDIRGNIKKMEKILEKLVIQKIDLAVFPELAVCGYPPRDLLDKPAFVEDNQKAVTKLAKKSKKIKILTGCVDLIDTKNSKKIFKRCY